jgi:hypothetical protein
LRFASSLTLFALPSLLTAQLVSFGVKGGLPVTAVSHARFDSNRGFSGTRDFILNRYTFGPTVEVKLPWAMRVEVDGLYHHVLEHAYGGPFPSGSLTYETSRTNIWEIPMLLKRRFGSRAFSPYGAVGGTLRHVSDIDHRLLAVSTFQDHSSTFLHETLPAYPSLMSGVTAAGGVSIRTRFVRIEPEIRYTHWTSQHFLETTEQVEFLVGFTFP